MNNLKIFVLLNLFACSLVAQTNLEVDQSIDQLNSKQLGASIDLFIQTDKTDLTLIKFPSITQEVNPIIDIELYNSSKIYRDFYKNQFSEGFFIIRSDRMKPMPGALPKAGDPNVLDSDREILELCRSSSSKYKTCQENGDCGNSDFMFGNFCNYNPTSISEEIGWGTDLHYFQSAPILENSVVIITDKPICSGLLVPNQYDQDSKLLTALHCNSHIKKCRNTPGCSPRVFKLSNFKSSPIMNLLNYEENLDLAIYGLEEQLRSSKLEFINTQAYPTPALLAGAGRVSPISFRGRDISQMEMAQATAMVSAPYTLCQLRCSGNNRLYHSCQTTNSTSGAPVFIVDKVVKVAGIHLSNQAGGECGDNVQESLPGSVISQFLNEVLL
jgi:hypothetical protein